MTQININVAKTKLSALIKRAVLGEEIIIAKDNKPIVKLVPIKTTFSQRKLGTAKGLFKIEKGFDDEIDDFDEYTK